MSNVGARAPGPVERWLGSSWIVGLMAVAAFGLSAWQYAWPLLRAAFSSYQVDMDPPDLVNLFCSGSEGIDVSADRRPPCDGSNSLVVLATPLFYINRGGPDKIVWLRREIVDLEFRNQAGRPVKRVALAWERVSHNEAWHSPGVEQIEPDKAVTHSTLYYPESFGCGKDVPSASCQLDNSYKWGEFAQKVVSREIRRVTFTFEPNFRGPSSQPTRKCELEFTDGQVAELQRWQGELDRWNKTSTGLRASLQAPYSLLSANCIAVQDGPT